MIKLALKHWIFEKCIDLLFNNIAMNFVRAGHNRLEKGKLYEHLRFELEKIGSDKYIRFSVFEAIVVECYPEGDIYEIKFGSMVTHTNNAQYASSESAFVKTQRGTYVQAWNNGISIFSIASLKYWKE